MADLSDRINELFRREQWIKARRLLEKERQKSPTDHWVLTQLGVTFYEEGHHDKAVPLFRASLKIVPDCPLTVWNLAGALDSLGNPAEAVRLYTWLLQSKTSAQEDPCWESQEWADALKTDCLYRLGVSFEHLGEKSKAENCFRKYLDLLLVGVEATYSIQEVTQRILNLHGAKNGSARKEIRKAVNSALRASRHDPGGPGAALLDPEYFAGDASS